MSTGHGVRRSGEGGDASVAERAFVFPGQGAQTVGMGQALAGAFPVAREVFQEVDDALSQKLTKLIWEGSQSDLTLTENAQPALMAVSMAVVRVLEKEGGLSVAGGCRFVAGHSLGEYSALAAAGTLKLADAARLLKRRGQAMQRAVKPGDGAMAALLGLDLDVVREVAEEASRSGVCAIANDNSVGQVVVSGAAEAVERAVEIAKERGGKRSVMLDVSAPFHCPLMQPAADEMAEALGEADLQTPSRPVVANVTASPVEAPDEIRRLLVEQVTATVRWRECVLAMQADGVEQLVELGAGKVLSGLAKRIDRSLATAAIGTPEDIESFVGGL